jgi:hypothetical protein
MKSSGASKEILDFGLRFFVANLHGRNLNCNQVWVPLLTLRLEVEFR